MTTIDTISALLIDDDKEDIEMTKEIMEIQKIKIDLETANNGVEAMIRLKDHNKKLPDLIFLDLNMPKKNGHEVLDEIKSDPKLKHIPVIILTSSKSGDDIASSYHSGASCYISKPIGIDEFKKVIDAINHFWFSVVKYPEKH